MESNIGVLNRYLNDMKSHLPISIKVKEKDTLHISCLNNISSDQKDLFNKVADKIKGLGFHITTKENFWHKSILIKGINKDQINLN